MFVVLFVSRLLDDSNNMLSEVSMVLEVIFCVFFSSECFLFVDFRQLENVLLGVVVFICGLFVVCLLEYVVVVGVVVYYYEDI